MFSFAWRGGVPAVISLCMVFFAFWFPTQPLAAQDPFETQVLANLEPTNITEASGLAASRRRSEMLWVHNDSGDGPVVYAIDLQGRWRGDVRLDGVSAADWEDMASGFDPHTGQPVLFAGDIGDNGHSRSEILVHRLVEPEVHWNAPESRTISGYSTFRFQYPDGPRDAEALLYDSLSGDLYIISKATDHANLYRSTAPHPTSGVRTLEKLGTFPYGWVTAADLSPNGLRLLVKTYGWVLGYKLPRPENRRARLEVTPQLESERLPYVQEPQGETVAWNAYAKDFYTLSEGFQVPFYRYRSLGRYDGFESGDTAHWTTSTTE